MSALVEHVAQLEADVERLTRQRAVLLRHLRTSFNVMEELLEDADADAHRDDEDDDRVATALAAIDDR